MFKAFFLVFLLEMYHYSSYSSDFIKNVGFLWTTFLPYLLSQLMFCLLVCLFFGLVGPHLQQMEVPRLGVELELLLLAYNTATEKQDLSHVFNLYHSSQQCQNLNPLSKARYQNCVLMDTSQVCYHWATMGTPFFFLLMLIRLSKFRHWCLIIIGLIKSLLLILQKSYLPLSLFTLKCYLLNAFI